MTGAWWWREHYIGILPCLVCGEATDSCSGLPCPHCGDDRVCKIKTAVDARKLTGDSSDKYIMPAIKKIRLAIEKQCMGAGRRLTYSTSGIPWHLHNKVCDHLRRQGFEIKVIFDQRDGNYFDINW